VTVLVTAASRHGSTEEIAERIGADLIGWGLEVDVRKLGEVDDVLPYEAVVLGSAIFYGKWMKEAVRFVALHADDLAARPTWLFGSGSIIGDPPLDDDPNAIRPALVEKLVTQTHAREHKVFAGKLDSSTLGITELLTVGMAHGREGDWRDWQAIDEWAAAIAGELDPDGRRSDRATRADERAHRDEERASGEEAIQTREGSDAEATPSRMNRLKTSRL
jgi:menaquinone-dependent protoporphyrinogen oxidase